MKNQIYILLFSIIALVGYTIFYNAKSHVETVETVGELSVKTDSLTETVTVLNKEKDSVICEKLLLDSTIMVQDKIISTQSSAIKSLKKDTATLKKVSTIIIRDTVYITESKNFWGKKKKSVETSSGVDTLLQELETDSVE